MLLLLVMVSEDGVLEIGLVVHGMGGMMVCISIYYLLLSVTSLTYLLIRQESATPAKRAFSKCATTEQSMARLEMAAVRIKNFSWAFYANVR